jgi:hypothetical protein
LYVQGAAFRDGSTSERDGFFLVSLIAGIVDVGVVVEPAVFDGPLQAGVVVEYSVGVEEKRGFDSERVRVADGQAAPIKITAEDTGVRRVNLDANTPT